MSDCLLICNNDFVVRTHAKGFKREKRVVLCLPRLFAYSRHQSLTEMMLTSLVTYVGLFFGLFFPFFTPRLQWWWFELPCIDYTEADQCPFLEEDLKTASCESYGMDLFASAEDILEAPPRPHPYNSIFKGRNDDFQTIALDKN